MPDGNQAMKVELVEGDKSHFGGFVIVKDGVRDEHISEVAEQYLDEIREVAYATGRPFGDLAIQLIRRDFSSVMTEDRN